MCTYYLQLSGSCYFSLIFIFHINIVYECIVLRCTVDNKLTYLLTYLRQWKEDFTNRNTLSFNITKIYIRNLDR